ncbi:N-methyltryptophan oxidase [Posidoniimonas polymericola]|uniref:N-methyltryptophan oxidase n=1 Tax=Posidoniimonas polymericola TaxID=2528002 RepID=A0A5C5YFD2_9BACT|nr:aminoacetone oxidase family FAD-binding enzyme [Posidoniimonas polymericola]TWT73503.1 N-methyltryptophan oxidase [Posidoniimonas polymericola]
MNEKWEVVVIGAGAAGMFAAWRAAARGRRVLLLEKNRKAGVKILMSGGTRCNLTHAATARDMAAAFGRQGERFLHAPFACLGPEDVVDLFHSWGVPTKVEETGKVFPVSNRALDVARACIAAVQNAGAVMSLGEPVEQLVRVGDDYEITTPARTVTTPRVVLSSGGRSWPGCGTTGDGYAWAKQLGHKIVPTRPALAPLTSTATWLHELQGVTLSDVRLSAVEPGAKPADTRRGSLLFTHFGLSGPVAMDLSRAITERPAADWSAVFDFTPDVVEEQLRERLRSGGKNVLAVLTELLPRSVVEQLLAIAGVPPDQRTAELGKAATGRIVDAVKRGRAPLSGTLGFKKAEVTAGGVSLKEVASRDMQSRVSPGLYLAGEVLDLDGPIGGYNFQSAFATGYLAGESV